jgi:N-acetylmuramoyl-L-alanine amidase
MRSPGAAFLLALLLPAAVGGQAADLRIEAGGPARIVEGVTAGAAAYPAAAALEALGGRVAPDARGASLFLFGDTIRVHTFSALVHLRGEVHQLAYPVVSRGGQLYLPEQFFIEWLPRRYPDRLAFAGGALRDTRALAALAAPAEPPPPPAAERRAPPVESAPPPRTGSATQPPAARQPPAATQPPAQPAPPPAARAPAPARRVVVIDPGHGGRDPGKVGPNRLREKDVALALGKRLAALLKERGYEVHLTRTTDTLVALADRPRLANRWKGGRPSAIFLSIHANSVARGDARGYETFFLSDARTEDERRVAEMENAAVEFEDVPGETSSELDGILASLRNDFYVRASGELAEIVQDELSLFHTGPNRGVKRAGFHVLVGALMPAVLVEVAFISNREEADLLGTSAFQDKVAFGLVEAVDRFFERNGHLLTAGAR